MIVGQQNSRVGSCERNLRSGSGLGLTLKSSLQGAVGELGKLLGSPDKTRVTIGKSRECRKPDDRRSSVADVADGAPRDGLARDQLTRNPIDVIGFGADLFVPEMAAVPIQIRRAIVRAVEQQGLTYQATADLFDVGYATVNRVLSRFRRTKRVDPLPRGGGRKSPIQGELQTC